ncbi:MAG: hypothetical protein K0B15_04205 [Lentimicrobium sp.]|nr:hypothetical protein [Lentimicrobium sp.]
MIDLNLMFRVIHSRQDRRKSRKKEFLFGLPTWGKGHHKVLHELNEQLKEDIWYDNQFWPF